VQLTAAADRRGHTQTGQFYGGAFRIAQRRARGRGGRGVEVTTLRLTGGPPTECAAAAARATTAKRRRRAKLWGRTRAGDFTSETSDVTAGRNDPTWLTEETCSGTLVKVTQGFVAVQNLRTHKTVVVRAGHSLFTAQRSSSAPPTSPMPENWSVAAVGLWCGQDGLPPGLACQSQTGAIPPVPPLAGEPAGGLPGVLLKPTGPAVLEGTGPPFPSTGVPFTPLAPGTTYKSRVSVTCSVTETSVRCSNSTGHGFTITRTSYTPF
jgi:hypothetical protein